MFRLGKIHLIFLLSILSVGAVLGQSLDQAKKMYNEGNYVEAKPVFERLIKQSPNNASYNMWYGVCCYETGDLAGAEKHLLVAAKRNVQDSFRYLGEIFTETYQFEKAEEMWDKYIAALTKKKLDTSEFEEKRKLTVKLQRMMGSVENIQVIDSTIVDKEAFLSAYVLAEESGSLAYASEFFNTQSNDSTSVYMNQKGDRIYYGKESEKGYMDIYSQSMLFDGWGDERVLQLDRISNENINYPFVMPDGVTVYYASTGSGSIGGYDLFVTRFNSNTNTYLAPEQLGMPFNSIYNDYMLVIDESKGLGWFVTDRYQEEGKVCVYLFIPDPSRKRIDSDDTEALRLRAMLHAIQDTWTEGSHYDDLVQLAKKDIPFGLKKVDHDFVFVIQDNVIYYKWDEIKSPEARNFYEKKMHVDQQITQKRDVLDGLRQKYKQGNASVKEQLSSTILQAELEYDALLAEPDEWEKQARNAELIYLRKQN